MPDVGLGHIAKADGAQAVDLTVLAALEQAVEAAGKSGLPSIAADNELIALCRAAADYLVPYVSDGTAEPKGIAALTAQTDQDFADALNAELHSCSVPTFKPSE